MWLLLGCGEGGGGLGKVVARVGERLVGERRGVGFRSEGMETITLLSDRGR